MGQQHSMKTMQEKNDPNSLSNQKSSKGVRKNMPPLFYVHPIYQEFQVEEDENNNGDFFGDNQSQKQNQDLQIKNTLPSNQNAPIIYKKVEVKWNKFIQMKNKNFTSDYKILHEIGRGGFGCVYKVVMKNGNILRAAKKINKSNLKTQQHKSLLAQMAIMMHMDHPNIIKLYEVYDQQNYYIMVLQLCEGGELFDKIVNRKISQNGAKHIIKQVLSALRYMHSQGIVHRDLKPQNMLFEKDTNLIKIIDFGISAKLTPGKMQSCRVGTPYYIAPQVLLKKYNQKCDLWSLGIVLYMILFNAPPFRGQSPTKVMESILKDDIYYKNPIPYGFSREAVQFLQCLLNRNMESRPSTQQALNHPWLKNIQNTQSVQSKYSNAPEVLQRISNFHFKNKLEAVVHTYIVSQLLSSEERAKVLNVFKQMDINQNGVIEIQQLKQALNTQKFANLSQQKIKIIKQYLDTNCSGSIDYTQYLVGAIDFDIKVKQKNLDQAFSYFDIDNSGEITFEEVVKFLQNQQTTIDEVKKLFKEVDENGDGVISKAEFVALLANKKINKL